MFFVCFYDLGKCLRMNTEEDDFWAMTWQKRGRHAHFRRTSISPRDRQKQKFGVKQIQQTWGEKNLRVNANKWTRTRVAWIQRCEPIKQTYRAGQEVWVVSYGGWEGNGKFYVDESCDVRSASGGHDSALCWVFWGAKVEARWMPVRLSCS